MDEHLGKVAAHHDAWAATYDADYLEHFTLYHRVTLDNIMRFLPADKVAPILDAGGGTGIFAMELARIGYRVILTDISKGMLDKAREKVSRRGLECQVEVMASNICDMREFEDNTFSMVLCEGDPLSYCGDHEAATKELARVVRPGGVVIASVDNRASALGWIRETDSSGDVDRLLQSGQVLAAGERRPPFEIHAFTSEELRQLFESHGLSVERMIGKLVIAHRLNLAKSQDPAIQEWLYRVELRYNHDPAYYAWAGHLEIVGRKR